MLAGGYDTDGNGNTMQREGKKRLMMLVPKTTKNGRKKKIGE
jgi:hypothetical protein